MEGYNGILRVSPFSTLAYYFQFLKMYGANMPADFNIMEGYTPARKYVNSYIKQCPDYDKVIVLSTKISALLQMHKVI